MLLKNLTVFRFTKPFETSVDDLNNALSGAEFKPCASLEAKRSGWVTPPGYEDGQFVRAVEGCFEITLKTEEKIIPGAVVDAEVSDRVEALESERGERVGRAEKKEIKEQVYMEMLPQAFSKYSHTVAYIDTVEGLLVVGEGSSNKAEGLASTLRSALGSLPVRPINVEQSPLFTMTELVDLKKDFTNNFIATGDQVDLVDPAESTRKASCRNLEPHAEEVRNHIAANMQVKSMSVQWNEQVSFVVDDALTLKKFTLAENVLEQLDDMDADDEMAYYEARFGLFSRTVRSVLTDLLALFGGEDLSAVTDEEAEDDE